MSLAGDFTLLGHPITMKFLVNDIFMVLFFGLAGKEVTEALLPGGSLNPPSKALSPLLVCVCVDVCGPHRKARSKLLVCICV